MSIDRGAAVPAPAPAAPRPRGLRVALIVAAVFEAYDGRLTFSAVSGSASDHAHGLGDALVSAKIVGRPLLALAALMFALIGRPRDALIAMAAILAMSCLGEISSVMLRGLELDAPVAVLLTLSHIVVYPLAAASAIALAVRGERLGLTTLMVVLPTFLTLAGVVAFAVAVCIH